ncbi:class I SAM-dependent DNA methyltransferase [Candidatus Formimonas warabiya]|uniref:Methyltransferase domain-containing protein n=1 Tax=Formimonas warabiya TaxID=1761012 RepID=A0A3G1KSR1_FORW1|nr:class I SAM-dependent methyltransferase [Candidatus Formimonas warabiya]ATW25467.1 hypothetical protein DCMF_12375 [Candidatus Formimonas warabiya]
MTYHAMASVYDRLMGHVDYGQWVDGLEYRWRQMGTLPRTVLDAGCGTGSVLLHLVRRHYQVYGIDNSAEMLAVCQDKLFQENLPAQLLEMDIRQIRLPGGVDAVICLCDTLNYLTEEKDLARCFKSIFRALKPGGSFIFDLRTPYYYQAVLADNQWVQQEDDVVLIWENDFSHSPIMRIDLTFFVKQGNGLFRRYVEEHQQKCYSIETIRELAEKTGFALNHIGGDLLGTSLDLSKDERMYFAVRKPINA